MECSSLDAVILNSSTVSNLSGFRDEVGEESFSSGVTGPNSLHAFFVIVNLQFKLRQCQATLTVVYSISSAVAQILSTLSHTMHC